MSAASEHPPHHDADRDRDLQIAPPKHHAAGLRAVLSALSFARFAGLRRTVPALLRVNQQDGFDCPGCAWPDPTHRHVAEFCENGAKAVAEESTKARVGPEFFARHSVEDLLGRSEYWLGRQGRLTHPMHLAPGADHYEPISWEDAFDLIAGELATLDDPDEALFYTSGRTSNEAAFLYQLLARAYGTNNLPDCSNMCHESSGSALTETIGIGKGTVSLEDLEAADLILVIGQNPGTNHPRMLSALEEAKLRGAKIISVNPLPEAGTARFKNPQRPSGVLGGGTDLTDLFLQIRINGDLALFQAINRLILDAEERRPGIVDRAFVEESTEGYEALRAHLADLDWDDVLTATGLTRDEIEEAAGLVMSARSVVACWAMGLTQHRNSVPTIREVVNMLLLGGNFGRPGAGACPVRGHSNVQGDRTMGIYERPSSLLLDRLDAEFGIACPREHGHDVVDAIRAMRDGRAGVFMAIGGNFASATPDTAVTEAALRSTRLTVQVSTKLNRSHLVTGRQALILPTLGRTERDVRGGEEQFVTVEDSMSVVHASRGQLDPAADTLRSEVAIIAGVAERLLAERPTAAAIPWADFADDYDLIRDRIAAVIDGFEDYNERARSDNGFVLPNPPRDDRAFATPSGKAQFSVNRLDVLRVPEGRLLLQTLRSHDQYNTTIYGLNDRYRGVKSGRRVVFVNADDLKRLDLSDGDVVDLVGEWDDGLERRADRFRIVAYPTPRGCAAAYYPETNPLVPLDSVAETSNTPTSKSVIIRLEPRGPRAQAPIVAELVDRG